VMERMGDLVTRNAAREAEHPGGGTTDGGVGRASRRDSQVSMSCFDDGVLPQTVVHTRRGGRRPPGWRRRTRRGQRSWARSGIGSLQ
jgi:hypothetical protein